MKFSFQTILISIFILVFIVAIFIFSGVIKVGSSSSQKITGQVLIWGTYPQAYMQPYLDAANIKNQDIVINYEQKNPDTFQSDLISALANRASPDIVISDSEHIFSFRDKLYVIPFTTYSERLYRDSFVDGASVFLSKEGVLAVPLTVDPLVVYYNKNLLAGQNYVFPPSTWSGLVQSLPKFIKKDPRGVITQTAIGLGEADNVDYFDNILSALFLQTGNPIVSINSYDGNLEQKITISSDEKSELDTVKALDFYTSFANQTSPSYSWNRNLPTTLDSFLAGKSAFYIGRASELFNIQARNPNLSFDVTTIFQPDDSIRPITYGIFSGAAILKSTTNFPAAYNVLGTITSKDFVQYLSSSISLPPARRDLLLEQQSNPYVQSYFKAALSSFAWPQTNPKATATIFRDMIRAVNTGKSSPVEAIYTAGNDLQSILK